MSLRITRKNANTLEIHCRSCGSGALSRQSIDNLFAGKKPSITVQLIGDDPPDIILDPGTNYVVRKIKLNLDDKRLRTRISKALEAGHPKALVVKGIDVKKVPTAMRRSRP
jgi:hypothetical protein